jgi:hypothetical protein
MNKLSFLSCVLILILVNIGCQADSNESSISADEKQHFIDSTKAQMQKGLDSITTTTLLDTTGLSLAPVKILYSSISKRFVELKWINVSIKKIKAIRFKWYALNAFDEPADLGASSIENGFGGGFSDTPLLPGKIDTGSWDIYCRDCKKLVQAWPFEVAFADGSKWKLNN